MRLPIGYALAYPDRLDDGRPADDPIEALGGKRAAALTALAFERPDTARFPCLRLAYEALAAGGTAPAVLSAANEVAVASFVLGEIRFGEIPVCIETVLGRVGRSNVSLEAVREADRLARIEARAFTSGRTARTSGST
jgi:1-deoxy-D-xylulose-5-phosphate reductoisomerase